MWNKYQQQKKQVTTDGGITWIDVIPYEYRKGTLIESNSPDCTPENPDCEIQYRWVDVPTDEETMCWDGNEWSIQKKYYSRDCGNTWIFSGVKQSYQMVTPNSSCCNGNTYICGEKQKVTVDYLSDNYCALTIDTDGGEYVLPIIPFMFWYDKIGDGIDYSVKYKYTNNPYIVEYEGGPGVYWDNRSISYHRLKPSTSMPDTFSVSPYMTNLSDSEYQGVRMSWTTQSTTGMPWAFNNASGNSLSTINFSYLQYGPIFKKYKSYLKMIVRRPAYGWRKVEIELPDSKYNEGYSYAYKYTMKPNLMSESLTMLPIVLTYGNIPSCTTLHIRQLPFEAPNVNIVEYHNKNYMWDLNTKKWNEISSSLLNDNYFILYGHDYPSKFDIETHFTLGC